MLLLVDVVCFVGGGEMARSGEQREGRSQRQRGTAKGTDGLTAGRDSFTSAHC